MVSFSVVLVTWHCWIWSQHCCGHWLLLRGATSSSAQFCQFIACGFTSGPGVSSCCFWLSEVARLFSLQQYSSVRSGQSVGSGGRCGGSSVLRLMPGAGLADRGSGNSTLLAGPQALFWASLQQALPVSILPAFSIKWLSPSFPVKNPACLKLLQWFLFPVTKS